MLSKNIKRDVLTPKPSRFTFYASRGAKTLGDLKCWNSLFQFQGEISIARHR